MDPASKMSTDNMINSLLCEVAWGKEDKAKNDWVLVADKPCVAPPQEGLVTYSDYLEYGKFQYAVPTGTKEEKAKTLAANKALKKEKKVLKKNFTSKGQPGETFTRFAELLKGHLRIPEHLQKACKASPLTELHQGNVFILPSFFYMMRKLQTRKRKFSIVLRTFGLDGKKVSQEFNAFCTGQHPMYPGVHFDGTNGSDDLRVKTPDNYGMIKRDMDADKDKVTLFMGTLEDEKASPKKLENFQDIYNHVFEHATKDGTSLAFRDDYMSWHKCAESESSGKLLVVKQHEEDGTRHIFFDDNIERTLAHIVDCRRYDGSSVPFSDSQNRWLSKAEPWLSITQPSYWVECLDNCEANISKWLADNKPQAKSKS